MENEKGNERIVLGLVEDLSQNFPGGCVDDPKHHSQLSVPPESLA